MSDERQFATVKEFAFMVQQHPTSIYRRIKEGRQRGVLRIGPRTLRIDLGVALRHEKSGASERVFE